MKKLAYEIDDRVWWLVEDTMYAHTRGLVTYFIREQINISAKNHVWVKLRRHTFNPVSSQIWEEIRSKRHE